MSPPPDLAARVRWPYVSAAVALLCILGFAAVTIAIFGHGPLLGIDRAVSRKFAAGRPHWLIRGFEAETSTAAFYPAASFLVLVSVVVALVERAWRPLLLGLAAVGLAGVSVATGKQVIGRSRLPFSADTFGEGGTSYPSGHTTMAVVTAGVLLLLFSRRMSVAVRRVCLALVLAYAGLTGFSRLYLHDHWFTDVLAGWLLGTAIVCLLAIAFESRRGVPQPRTLA